VVTSIYFAQARHFYLDLLRCTTTTKSAALAELTITNVAAFDRSRHTTTRIGHHGSRAHQQQDMVTRSGRRTCFQRRPGASPDSYSRSRSERARKSTGVTSPAESAHGIWAMWINHCRPQTQLIARSNIGKTPILSWGAPHPTWAQP